MQNCVNCGKSLPLDAAFCPECGTARPGQIPAQRNASGVEVVPPLFGAFQETVANTVNPTPASPSPSAATAYGGPAPQVPYAAGPSSANYPPPAYAPLPYDANPSSPANYSAQTPQNPYAANPSSPINYAAQTPQNPYTANPSSPANYSAQAPQSPYVANPSSPINYAAQAPQSPYVANPSSPVYSPQPGQFPAGNSMPGYYPSLPSLSPQLKPPRAGLSKKALIISGALICLALLVGLGLVWDAEVYQPQQLHAAATVTAQKALTADAQSSATANAQATGTAVAQVTATAQAAATATAQMQATATAFQGIYSTATSGTPAVNDSLAGPSATNWDTFDTTDGGGCAFNNGALHSTVLSVNYYVSCYAKSPSYSNFAIEVTMTFVKGDEGGMIFRGDSTNHSYYSFTITSDGHYVLYLAKGNKNGQTLINQQSSLIKTGNDQANTLSIVAKDSNFYMYINKQFVGSASDNTFNSGQVALISIDNANGTEVAFTNVRTWTL